MDYTGISREAQHLCILVHGLWGNPVHLRTVADTLRKKHPEENLHILVAKRNSGSFTYDGIERGGERVCQEIEEEIKKLAKAGQKIKRLSFVGYSLGGLVARYAVGLLDSKGLFNKIEPINFTTFATPHLGVRTPLRGWHNHIWNVLGARTLSASGRQLFTIDKFRDTGKPLLEILADPESIFIKALAKFQRRTLYANIINDRSAVYYTTGISRTDPYTDPSNVKITYIKGYSNVIVDPTVPVAFSDSEETESTFYSRFLRSSQTTLGRLPFLFAVCILIPIGVCAFLINSAVQSLRSNRRIKLYEQGLTGIQPSYYRVPVLITGMREAVEDVYENLNSAQSHEYLVAGTEDDAAHEEPPSPGLARPASWKSVEIPQDMTSIEKTTTNETWQHDVPTLALAPYQFRMIQALDDVGWRKFPVHIHKARHSHAAIIMRSEKPSLDEGKIVLAHWLDEEFII
ncbi:putative serine esterase-domain-containing protein [Calycina marina]|uniref:Serine esterase-domain-containing protein n=1 Tax=Calycina marina TaxID=1763456 RepID=A0A9P7ZA87_9HELO|nr:putative serine esterase-domain-containing protein [Calycina marina]